MIDTSFTAASSPFSVSAGERRLRAENTALVQANGQLQGENRDLRAEQRRLQAENGDLQRDVAALERLSMQQQQTGPGARVEGSGSLLDVYA